MYLDVDKRSYEAYLDALLDLGTVLAGRLYRKKLTLCNRGKIAFKVEASPPPELHGILEFGDMGFVQVVYPR